MLENISFVRYFISTWREKILHCLMLDLGNVFFKETERNPTYLSVRLFVLPSLLFMDWLFVLNPRMYSRYQGRSKGFSTEGEGAKVGKNWTLCRKSGNK